jgi:Holliday junction DNA helicase RuvA
MYNYINGKFSEITPGYVVSDVGGVGYLIYISLNTYGRIKDLSECRLFIHQTIREDAHLLYGFYSEEERRLFRNLISVSGIGSNTAILILSAMDIVELSQSIIQGDVPKLKKIKGIGLKTAQRIIVDLKDKIVGAETAAEKIGLGHNTRKEEALSGLMVLGFTRKQADKALDEVLKASGNTEIDVEDLIKEALKRL